MVAQYIHGGKCLKPQATSLNRDDIAWSPPPSGFVKVNSDGSVVDQGRKVACGGVLRDHNGMVISAFAAKLGHNYVAWDKGFRNIIHSGV